MNHLHVDIHSPLNLHSCLPETVWNVHNTEGSAAKRSATLLSSLQSDAGNPLMKQLFIQNLSSLFVNGYIIFIYCRHDKLIKGIKCLALSLLVTLATVGWGMSLPRDGAKLWRESNFEVFLTSNTHSMEPFFNEVPSLCSPGKAYPPEFYYDTYSPLWQNRPRVYGFKLQWTQMNPNAVDRIVAYRLGIRQVELRVIFSEHHPPACWFICLSAMQLLDPSLTPLYRRLLEESYRLTDPVTSNFRYTAEQRSSLWYWSAEESKLTLCHLTVKSFAPAKTEPLMKMCAQRVAPCSLTMPKPAFWFIVCPQFAVCRDPEWGPCEPKRITNHLSGSVGFWWGLLFTQIAPDSALHQMFSRRSERKPCREEEEAQLVLPLSSDNFQ